MLVLLLQRRNFAVGSTLVKSEAIFTALFGLLFFGEHISLLAWLAISLGILGLLVASMGKFNLSFGTLLGGIDSMSAKLGISAGVAFAIASACIRQANLSLVDIDSPLSQATVTLSVVLIIQTVIGGALVFSRNHQALSEITDNWRICAFIGLTSMIGSFGWFAAYALQNAAYVKTVGQIEFIFTLALTWFYFKEKGPHYEYWAILLVALSAILIIWTA
ncbi:MAG: drug/metabolite transporter (DMT)-like permease [Gammaproteobacteria bacterium]